jgi:hypothetical protein
MQYLEIIDKIAAKLAVPTSAVVQAYAAHGVVTGIYTIGGLVLFTLSVICVARAVKALRESAPDADFYIALGTVLAVAGGIGFIMFFKTVGDFALWFTNPQAYAVYTLVEKVLK